jgi:hypothetical protein
MKDAESRRSRGSASFFGLVGYSAIFRRCEAVAVDDSVKRRLP